MRYRFMTLLTALVLAVGGGRLMAQETTGAVTGRITDPQGLAVPGVTLTLTGPQGTKAVVTDAEGRFNAPLLVPGTYVVKAELVGFKTVQQSNVIVRLGQSIEVNLKMDVGGVAETIEVNATSPIIDTRSTTVGAVLDSETLANIPIGRRFSDTLYIAPGVTSSGSAGRSNPSMAGGSGLDNAYVVDGVNITNAGYGALGSYSIIFGSLGNGTPYDFIKEVQVKTGGYGAEFGQATGGVVNVITKSGSNDFHGGLFGFARNQSLNARTYFEEQTGAEKPDFSQQQFGGTLGGPIKKDKAHFFLSYERNRRNETATIFTNGVLPDDLVVWDETRSDPAIAFMLAQLEPPAFPTPIGVYRAVSRPTYEQRVIGQIQAQQDKQGTGTLEGLLYSGEVWRVEADGNIVRQGTGSLE